MARWDPGSGDRLAGAALELFGERGFENTTVAEIAERAGLTERTFFRYFADKREVLFSGGADLQDLLVSHVKDAPASMDPLENVSVALQAAGALIQQRPEFSKKRQAVIDANPVLRERELIKLAGLGSALAGALRERGVADPVASLTAEAGIAAFKIGFERWIEDPGARDLPQAIRDSLAQLKSVTAG